jgi:hypothetical protein
MQHVTGIWESHVIDALSVTIEGLSCWLDLDTLVGWLPAFDRKRDEMISLHLSAPPDAEK